MVRDIKAIANLKKCSEIFNLLVMVFAGLIMILVTVILSRDNNISANEIRYMITGGIIGAYVSLNLFLKIFFVADEVPRGLSFGMTRRKLFIGSRIVDLLEVTAVTILSIIFFREASPMIVIKIALLVFGLFMWTEAVGGNNVVRYGKIAYWIYYILFMACTLFLPRVLHNMPGSQDAFAKVVDYITNPMLNQYTVCGSLLIFIVAGLLVNWITFRKLAVNYAV